MTFIDTHTHLYESKFDEDRNEMIQRAFDNDIKKLLIPNVDADSISGMLDIVHQFPNQIFPMMGLHPCSVQEKSYKKELEIIHQHLFNKKENYVAVGEIGIDLYWDKSTLEIQKEAFELQCDWAVELDLPIAIHSRDSTYVLLDILKKRTKNHKGVFHCFTGSVEEANEIIKLGFYLGIGGVVTYKNTHLRDTLKQISLEHLVLETDAPYLPPVPYRGKRNESAYIKNIAETLCSVYEKSLDEIATITTQNAESLFNV